MMRGSIKEEYYLDRKLFIYLPPSYGKSEKKFPVLYSHDGKDLERIVEKLILFLEEDFEKGTLQECIWVGIYPTQNRRHHEYTPWPAPALDPRFEDFEGLGNDYIRFVAEDLKTYIDQRYATLPEEEHTWMMGYSLGGLISIYSAYLTPKFGKIACICGSFWYQDAVSWIKQHEMLNPKVKLFVYYGKKEGQGKETIQQHAVQCAENVVDVLRQQHSNQLEAMWDEGGHHHYVEGRYQNAIKWLLQ